MWSAVLRNIFTGHRLLKSYVTYDCSTLPPWLRTSKFGDDWSASARVFRLIRCFVSVCISYFATNVFFFLLHFDFCMFSKYEILCTGVCSVSFTHHKRENMKQNNVLRDYTNSIKRKATEEIISLNTIKPKER